MWHLILNKTLPNLQKIFFHFNRIQEWSTFATFNPRRQQVESTGLAKYKRGFEQETHNNSLKRRFS
jgi:hypothetical protein